VPMSPWFGEERGIENPFVPPPMRGLDTSALSGCGGVWVGPADPVGSHCEGGGAMSGGGRLEQRQPSRSRREEGDEDAWAA
jgi:hypothetical protein